MMEALQSSETSVYITIPHEAISHKAVIFTSNCVLLIQHRKSTINIFLQKEQEGPWFKSRPRGRLLCFVILLNPSRQMSGEYLKLGHGYFLPYFSQVTIH
jgi:hypothetical protein